VKPARASGPAFFWRMEKKLCVSTFVCCVVRLCLTLFVICRIVRGRVYREGLTVNEGPTAESPIGRRSLEIIVP
jgi:hypothetical protein